MGDETIIRSVVQRFRTMTAAKKTNWFREAWSVTIEDAKQGVSDDTLKLEESCDQLRSVSEIFRGLVGPLKSPKLSLYADRIDDLIGDLKTFSQLMSDCVSLMDDLDREWESLMSMVAKGERSQKLALKQVETLPAYKRYLALAEKAGDIQDKVTGIFESYDYIDWTLENYLGPEAGIYDELESKRIGDPFDEVTGSLNLFGVLVLYTDEEVLQNWLKDSKD